MINSVSHQKRAYLRPSMVVESVTVEGVYYSCSVLKINSLDVVCVATDPAATPGMKSLALGEMNFLGYENCPNGTPSHDPGDGVCIHTAINLAFNS